MTRRPPEEELQDFARLQVRAGLLDDDAVLREVREAVEAELPHLEADVLARAWIAGARKDVRAEQQDWSAATDHDRLQDAFAECAAHDLPVLQGVEDHWAANAELERRATAGTPPRGVLWFTAPDVWHAIDEGMLEVNLWHPTAANAAPGDQLLDAVLSCFSRHGLSAHFDEGRIEVTAHWRRRV